MEIEVLRMTYDNFKPFGCMLSCPEDIPPDISVDDLDYWKRPMDLSNFEGNGELSFMRVKQRKIEITMMDYLPESAELYLSLDGRDSVFLTAPASGDNSSGPDMNTIQAFLFSGPGGVLINPGVWHWTPFPLNHDADFLLGLRNNVLPENEGQITQGENQVIYYELNEKVEIKL